MRVEALINRRNILLKKNYLFVHMFTKFRVAKPNIFDEQKIKKAHFQRSNTWCSMKHFWTPSRLAWKCISFSGPYPRGLKPVCTLHLSHTKQKQISTSSTSHSFFEVQRQIFLSTYLEDFNFQEQDQRGLCMKLSFKLFSSITYFSILSTQQMQFCKNHFICYHYFVIKRLINNKV